MFIPKNRMHVIVHAIDEALKSEGWQDRDRELLNQIADKAALVSNGDANFLEIDTCYAHNPPGHIVK
jgi:hypothetical protein